MIEPIIICSNCSTKIKLTESLAAPMIQTIRKEYAIKAEKKESEFFKRERELRTLQENINDSQRLIDEKVLKKVTLERISIAANEARKAKAENAFSLDEKINTIAELEKVLKQRNEKLAEAQELQANILRKERKLEDKERELNLTIERRVQHSFLEEKEKAKKEAEDIFSLKLFEKEEKISSMQRQILILQRKSEQGSQQLQGEVLEIALEQMLCSKFPLDVVEPVAKGEFGGDIIQRVVSRAGLPSGLILWETKRTSHWSNSWISKLRNDQRVANASIAILISQTLPKNVLSFTQLEGIWVASPKYSEPLAIILRQMLIEIESTKKSQEGQHTKMELVYRYLTGSSFRHRIEAIVENFSSMQSDLEREKKATTRLWAKRGVQIQGVIESTVGMYGDLQGIVGRALQEIEGLEVPVLEEVPK